MTQDYFQRQRIIRELENNYNELVKVRKICFMISMLLTAILGLIFGIVLNGLAI